ncbi:MAG: alpha/beta fold hydrolase [Dehalococcoidia bacterium]|nr:alpha/beta fold hydrolase [Dehalococcoidia bacterium]
MTDFPIDQTAMLGGLRFHYREWPNPGAQALVLLHGFTGHARSWESFALAMQTKYHVYALDQRGHGDSAWAEDYSATAMVEDAQRLVTALGLKRFVLLGLSMGGRNAYQFAATYPEEVERLVIVDIGPAIAATGATRITSGVRANDVFASVEEAVAAGRAGNPRADEAELQHRTRNNLMLQEDGTWTFRYDKGVAHEQPASSRRRRRLGDAPEDQSADAPHPRRTERRAGAGSGRPHAQGDPGLQVRARRRIGPFDPAGEPEGLPRSRADVPLGGLVIRRCPLRMALQPFFRRGSPPGRRRTPARA